MTIRQVTESLGGTSWPVIMDRRVPRMRRVAVALSDRFEAGSPLPPSEAIEKVQKRIIEAASRGALAELPKRDWRLAPWCLWARPAVPASDRRILDAYKTCLDAADRRHDYQRLISAYLYFYSPRMPARGEIGALLARKVQAWRWVWADRQKEYRLFDSEGPERVADYLGQDHGDYEAVCRGMGFGGDLAAAGFMTEVYKTLLEKLGKASQARFAEMLSRVTAWSLINNSLRFPSAAEELAAALLLPWERKEPEEKIRREIEEFLLQHFRDPRIPGPGNRWAAVSDRPKAVLMRWLVRASLEQFLRVVDALARNEESRRQWEYRRAFWTAYFKKGVIDGAWVAFASDGSREARRIFGRHQGYGEIASGSPVKPDHAVLILKIGGMTVADWSHNGKCNIWKENKREAPQLYKSIYKRNELIEGSSNGGVVHSSPAYGNWQAKVAEYIWKHTGISLRSEEYMPRKRR